MSIFNGSTGQCHLGYLLHICRCLLVYMTKQEANKITSTQREHQEVDLLISFALCLFSVTCRSVIKLGLHRCSACAPPFPAPSQKMCKSHMSSTPQAFLERLSPKRTYSIVSLSFNGWTISSAQEHSPFAQGIRKIWVWYYMPKRLMSLQFPDSRMDFHSLMKCRLDTAEKNEDAMFLHFSTQIVYQL